MFNLPKKMREIHSIGSRTRERVLGARGTPVLTEFGIALTGVSETNEGFHFNRLRPGDTQLLAAMSGWGEVMLGGRWEKMGPGLAYLTPPGIPHAYRARRGGKWKVAWVIYRDWTPRRLGFPLPESPAVIPAPARQLWHAIEGACDAAAPGDPAATAAIRPWARLIHQTVLQALDAHERPPRLAALWSAVSADLSRPWTLDDLAQSASMSKEHLRRVCLREHGASPIRQLARLRVNRAIELLSSSPDKLASVAERVGYGDPFAFSAAFKRETGKRPSAFRL